jgi:hypothetical protein
MHEGQHQTTAFAVGDVEGDGLVGGPVGECPRRKAPSIGAEGEAVGALAFGEGVLLDAEFERRLEDGDEVLKSRGEELGGFPG